MLRRWLIVVPGLTGLCGLLGALLARRPVEAIIVGVVVGLATAIGLSVVMERRLDEATARVRQLVSGAGAPPRVERGSQGWRRLSRELNAVHEFLQERYEDLAVERARGERLLDSIPTAVMVFEDDGLTYANPVAQRLFGVGKRSGRSPLQILGVEALADAVGECMETGRSVDVEVERGDRHLCAHAGMTAPGSVALLVTDDTDSRRLEAIRRDFVTNASHELKTPVAGMQALADSLGMAVDRDPERARSMIVRLQIEATRLSRLVRELLDLARLEEDEAAAATRQRVDLAEVVRVQADRIGALAEARQITIDFDCDRPAPVVAAPADMRLVVANLLENAVRYNRDGGQVTVTLRRSPSEVCLEVTDTGIGIPEADRDRVFERFYRVDKARSRAAGGTGLGLSIVRHAVQRHGGEVAVDSVLGEGSTFRVLLPVEGAGTDRR